MTRDRPARSGFPRSRELDGADLLRRGKRRTYGQHKFDALLVARSRTTSTGGARRALLERENVTLSVPRDDDERFGNNPSSLLAVGRSRSRRRTTPTTRSPTCEPCFGSEQASSYPAGSTFITALRCSRRFAVATCRRRARSLGALESLEVFPHGDVLFAHAPEATRGESDWLAEQARRLTEVSAGRPLGAELVLDEMGPRRRSWPPNSGSAASSKPILGSS